MRGWRSAFVAGVSILLTLAPHRAVAQGPTVIYGHVQDSGGNPLRGADVGATRISDLKIFSATTDSAGHYRLSIPSGGREFLVFIRTLGFAPYQQHLAFARGDTAAQVNAVLAPNAPQQLATVQSRAKPNPPARTPNNMVPPPGTDGLPTWTGVTAGLSPDQMGDLNALLNLVPGMNGGSLYGLSPNQNGALLEGLSFGGGKLPRGADLGTTVAKSQYDPSVGQFSGALTETTLEGASLMRVRTADLTIDAPPLQYNDPVSARLGDRYFQASPSLSATGATAGNRVFYNMSGQYTRRMANTTSLLTANPDVLYAVGLSPDSAQRAVALARGAGIPVDMRGASSNAISDNAVFLGRFDFPKSLQDPGVKGGVWSLLLYANLSRDASPGSMPTGTPSLGGSSRSDLLRAQIRHSTYFGPDKLWLNDIRSGFTASTNHDSPWVMGPSGNVLVGSTLPDGSGALSSLALGGAGNDGSRQQSWTWETTNTTQRYVHGPANQLKLYADSRFDGFDNRSAASNFGEFSYNSLADLAANQPASYTRALRSPSTSGGAWYGALALGDEWRKSPQFAMQGGLRLEGNRYLDTPDVNPAVARAFGLRNDAMPNTLHVSPRVGFSWVLARNQELRSAMVYGDNGGSYYQGPYGMLRGGIGEWRGALDPAMVAGPQSATGLQDGSQTLTCIGSATPTPDWAAYATNPGSVPSACAGGAPGVFSDAAPDVRLIDPSYTAARRQGANLAWDSRAFGFRYGIDATYALNLDQPGAYNLNFVPTPRFTLPEEANRPVYVSDSSVVPATGMVSPVESRRTPAFGSVFASRSDLRGSARQVTFRLAPERSSQRPGPMRPSAWRRFWQQTNVSLAYTYADDRVSARGFDGSTAGDPTALEWGQSPRMPRQKFMLQLAIPTVKHLTLGMFATLQSGLPYTPRVNGDINGDGLFNDQAFVFDPARTTDAALASQMSSLLASAPSDARSCLVSQLGTIAGRNSCSGPWTMNLNVRISAAYPIRFMDRMAFVSVNLANPLGGLDQMLHGADHLRGWGTNPQPDPMLYYVRGFDPNTHAFKYEVNPRFGSTSASQSTLRAPFRITLDVQMFLNAPYAQQMIERSVSLAERLRDHPLDAVDTVRYRFRGTLPDIYEAVLRQTDSLFLSQAQMDSLRVADVPYRRQVDSLVTSFAQYLVLLPKKFDMKAVIKEQERITQLGWNTARDQKAAFQRILTPHQYDALRSWVPDVLESTRDVRQRFGTVIF